MPPPPPPPFSPTPAVAVQVVTLTVYSSGSSTQSGLPPLTSGGGTSVPVAAIAGGAAGGVALAVLLVIIWKHWGRVIKRTERHRRKEVVRPALHSVPPPLCLWEGHWRRKGWLMVSRSKTYSPCGKIPGGTLRRGIDRNRSTARWLCSTQRAAR
jgi:hypothetical protein